MCACVRARVRMYVCMHAYLYILFTEKNRTVWTKTCSLRAVSVCKTDKKLPLLCSHTLI